MPNKEKIWYATKGKPYTGMYPPFFNKNEFSFTPKIESAITQIQQEVISYINANENQLKPYFNKELVSRKNAWQLLTLKFWGTLNQEVEKSFPVLSSLIQEIPGTLTCAISIMEPNTIIHPHMGDTSAIIRCHIPVEIPASLPQCGIEVNRIQQPWKEGELLLFCDAHEHSAWNKSEFRRIIVIMDIVHPNHILEINSICRNTLALLWLQKKKQESKFYAVLPGIMQGIVFRLRKIYYLLFGIKSINP